MANPNSIALEPVSDIDLSDIIICDAENPRALTNLVSDKVRDAIQNVVVGYPHYFEPRSEHDQRNLLKPDEVTCRVRISFWQEYFRAQDMGQKMQMSRVYSGVTSRDVFYGPILARPQNVAWLITPPARYMLAMEEALSRGMHNLTTIMGMNLLDEAGDVKPKAAAIFLKAFELLSDRVNGAVVQRIEQKNLHLSAKVGGQAQDMDQLRAELEALRSTSQNLPEIEAKSISEENS